MALRILGVAIGEFSLVITPLLWAPGWLLGGYSSGRLNYLLCNLQKCSPQISVFAPSLRGQDREKIHGESRSSIESEG